MSSAETIVATSELKQRVESLELRLEKLRGHL